MGWDVTWDAENECATVTKGNVKKIFSNNSDEYIVEEGNAVYYEFLQNKVTSKNGVLYVDLDGVLDSTGYSYYVSGTSYHIKDIDEVFNKVVSSNLYDNYNVVASRTLLDEVNYTVEVSKDEFLISLIPKREGYFYSILVPAANQTLKGNYYDGELTWEGLIGEIFAGELFASDIRDLSADIVNWESSFPHLLQTGIDFIAFVPFVGSLKYTDDAIAVLRKTGKTFDATDVADANKLLKQTGSIEDVTKSTLKKLDNYDDVAKGVIKRSDEIADAASKVVKRVEKPSSRKLTKNLKKQELTNLRIIRQQHIILWQAVILMLQNQERFLQDLR